MTYDKALIYGGSLEAEDEGDYFLSGATIQLVPTSPEGREPYTATIEGETIVLDTGFDVIVFEK